MKDIGIVGCGLAGLQLALRLLDLRRERDLALRVTVYATQRPDEMRRARLPSTTALFHTALAQMEKLGVAHWSAPDTRTHDFDFDIEGADGMSFFTTVVPPLQFIDMRLCLPQLLEDFAERGGQVVYRDALDRAGISTLGEEHDLVVVAAGRGPIAGLFERIPERSPFTEPQRHLMGGLFRGIRFPERHRFTQRIVPGHGELCEFQILTHSGPVSGLLVWAIPGGDLDSVTRISHEADPAAFNRAVLTLLHDHAEPVYERVDAASFGALGPLDVLQSAVVPVVRRGFARLPSGRFALALGDAHVTVDPIVAQGANAACRAAWLLGELLAARIEEDGAFDDVFCASVEERLWALLQPVAEWSNAALLPPPPHVLELIGAAARSPRIAETFVANFDRPERQWRALGSPEGTAEFIQEALNDRSNQPASKTDA